MPKSYTENKVHIYNNRAKNRDKYNDYQRLLLAKNRDFKRANNYEYTAKAFRQILY